LAFPLASAACLAMWGFLRSLHPFYPVRPHPARFGVCGKEHV
jgi:hypothetical protein